MSGDGLLCMSCGERKHGDGFPNRAFAQCWNCAWIEHLRAKHPRVVKDVKKRLQKRAKSRMARDAQSQAEELLAHALGDEAAILVGPEQAPRFRTQPTTQPRTPTGSTEEATS